MDFAELAMSLPSTATDFATPIALLPFAFAKRHGVLLREQGLQVRHGARPKGSE